MSPSTFLPAARRMAEAQWPGWHHLDSVTEKLARVMANEARLAPGELAGVAIGEFAQQVGGMAAPAMRRAA